MATANQTVKLLKLEMGEKDNHKATTIDKRPRLIGLYSSAPQSGKTTAAQYLRNEYNYFVRSFASPIKKMINELMLEAGFDCSDRIDHERDKKEVPIPLLGNNSHRQLSQTLGFEWGRKRVDADLWVNVAFNDMNFLNKIHSRYVFDDVRFPNEYHAIKSQGGVVWHIRRDSAQRPNDHPSEGLLDDFVFDRIIDNNVPLNKLYDQINRGVS